MVTAEQKKQLSHMLGRAGIDPGDKRYWIGDQLNTAAIQARIAERRSKWEAQGRLQRGFFRSTIQGQDALLAFIQSGNVESYIQAGSSELAVRGLRRTFNSSTTPIAANPNTLALGSGHPVTPGGAPASGRVGGDGLPMEGAPQGGSSLGPLLLLAGGGLVLFLFLRRRK